MLGVMVGVGLAVPLAASEAVAPLDLEGDWYVLVHYRDAASELPEQAYWDDEIWRFRTRGERLRWTLHPHVSLRDDTGRTEKLPSGEVARTLGAWSPSAAQETEIRKGLAADDHESRSKEMKGSTEAGFRSAGALRAQSTSLIAYHEAWRIDSADALPVFSREDSMGSGRTERAEGRTVFTTEEVVGGGDELRGVYSRDGRLEGRFRMIRTRVGGRR